MQKIIKSTLAKLKWLVVPLILVFGFPVGYFVLGSGQPGVETESSSPKKGVGVYVINLDRSKERYEYVKDNIQSLGLNVERIAGIDGAMLSEQDISKQVDFESYKLFMGHLPKRGTIGCSLSHIKVWKNFLKSHFEFAVIFEDDVSFDAHRLKITIEDLIKSHEFWDVATFEISHQGFPARLTHLTHNQHLVVYLMEVAHSGCYILSRRAAKSLLRKAFPIKMPLDHYFTRAWEFGIKFTGIENPRLVHQTLGDSDISKTQTLPYERLGILQYMRHSLFKLQSYAIRFFYNLKVYLTTPSA